MKIASLVLTDQNNAIGKHHLILQYLPNFVKYFKDITKDYPLIMGRRTFENVGPILKSKRNIVITSNEKYHSSRAQTYDTFLAAVHDLRREKKLIVVGGAGVFNKSLPYTAEIYRACVKARFKADSYYPEIDTEEFDLEFAECIHADKENRFDYCIEKWVRTGERRRFKFEKD